MRIVVAGSLDPFRDDVQLSDVDQLYHCLNDQGHEVERVELPFVLEPGTMLEQLLAIRLLDLTQSGDRLIAIGPPAFLLRHPNKVTILPERSPFLIDLWDPGTSNLGSIASRAMHDRFRRADVQGMSESRALYGMTDEIVDRVDQSYGLSCERIELADLHHRLIESLVEVRSKKRLVPFGLGKFVG